MRKLTLIAALVLAVALASVAMALIGTEKGGPFPASWPAELAPYRAQTKTVQVAHGIQENVYEIPFTSSEDFAKAWPYLLKLKSKGAPLILENSPSMYSVSGSTMSAGVRVLWPADGSAGLPDGTRLSTGATWPDYLLSASGELPEYVVLEGDKWAPFTGSNGNGFRYRARVDIVLVVDGKIVDLNKVALPADTPIVDHRFPQ
jgi:hypothetical protein